MSRIRARSFGKMGKERSQRRGFASEFALLIKRMALELDTGSAGLYKESSEEGGRHRRRKI